MTRRRPLAPGEQLRPIKAAASALGVSRKTILNLLYEHDDDFYPRQYRGKLRVLTDAEIERLSKLLCEIRVKEKTIVPLKVPR